MRINPKSEYRNRLYKQIQMTKIQMTKTREPLAFVLNFGHLNFEFVSNFEFRASNFVY
jgi:hypothetical protein